jgi:DNA-binding CsgD family transcriptional regulator
VLELAALGYTTEEIGHQLYLAPETVKGYFAQLRVQLSARNRTHAVVLALATGQITFEEVWNAES